MLLVLSFSFSSHSKALRCVLMYVFILMFLTYGTAGLLDGLRSGQGTIPRRWNGVLEAGLCQMRQFDYPAGCGLQLLASGVFCALEWSDVGRYEVFVLGGRELRAPP